MLWLCGHCSTKWYAVALQPLLNRGGYAVALRPLLNKVGYAQCCEVNGFKPAMCYHCNSLLMVLVLSLLLVVRSRSLEERRVSVPATLRINPVGRGGRGGREGGGGRRDGGREKTILHLLL